VDGTEETVSVELEREDRIDVTARELMEADAGEGAYGAVDLDRRSSMISRAVALAKDGAEEQTGSGRAPKWIAAIAAAGLAAAAAVAIILGVGHESSEAAGAPSKDRGVSPEEMPTALGHFTRARGGITADGDPVHASDALLAGQEIVVREAGTLVEIGRGIQLAPTAGSSFSVARGGAGLLVVSLRRGAVWSAVDPKKKSANLSVETPRGVVNVKGTVFGVEVDEDEATVKVLRGTVAVDEKDGDLRLVIAGQMLTMGATRIEAMGERAEVEARGVLAEAGIAPSALAPSAATSESPYDTTHAKGGDEAQAGSGVSSPGKEGPVPSVNALLARIRALRVDEDWGGVESAYADLIRFHFNTDDARAAMVALGTIRLEKLDDPAGALGSFSSYLATGATALEPEALYGKACTLGKLGDLDGQRDALRSFVSRFPSSPQVPAARKSLASLAVE
jgi:hypothetical protein